MAGLGSDNIPETTSPLPVDGLANSLAKATIQDEANLTQATKKDKVPAKPMKIYTRRQLLLLHNSSLVQLPPNMPGLKDWFGYELVSCSCICLSQLTHHHQY